MYAFILRAINYTPKGEHPTKTSKVKMALGVFLLIGFFLSIAWLTVTGHPLEALELITALIVVYVLATPKPRVEKKKPAKKETETKTDTDTE